MIGKSKVKVKNVSTLESIIHQAWKESSLIEAKKIVKDHIEGSRIKSKDKILSTLDNIQSKYKLDYYLANSLLYFEGHSLNK